MNTCNLETCNKELINRHKNTRFCNSVCSNKHRYLKHGSRVTPERSKELYEIRVQDPEYRRTLNEKANKRAANIRAFLADYKLEKGCKDCGYNLHQCALDFDHIGNDKSFNLADAKSIGAAKIEILKCEVVCSNCHRLRSYNRYHNLPCRADIFELTYEKV